MLDNNKPFEKVSKPESCQKVLEKVSKPESCHRPFEIKRKNKKAQLGETITWIVATLVILGVLLLFIYASLVLAKAKSLNSIKVKEHANSLIGEDDDWIQSKSEMAFIRNPENKKQILAWINDKQGQENEEE